MTKYDSQLVIAEKEGLKNGAVNGASTGVFICALCIFYGVGLYAGARFIGLNRAEYPECILDPSFSYNCFGGGQVIQTIFSIIGGAAAMGIVGNLLYFIIFIYLFYFIYIQSFFSIIFILYYKIIFRSKYFIHRNCKERSLQDFPNYRQKT